MTENGLFVLGRPETQLHDILWAFHDGKNHGRSEGVEKIGDPRLRWVVGGRAMCVSLVSMRMCVRRWALTEPERGVGL